MFFIGNNNSHTFFNVNANQYVLSLFQNKNCNTNLYANVIHLLQKDLEVVNRQNSHNQKKLKRETENQTVEENKAQTTKAQQ